MLKNLEQVAIYAKRQELNCSGQNNSYMDGKAAAFAEIWEKCLFGETDPSPELYNRRHEEWCTKVKGIKGGSNGSK